MVRYCANSRCSRYDTPLPPSGGPCPDCGSSRHRLDPDVATHVCRECTAPNAGTDGECWQCGARLVEQLRLE